MGLIDGRKIRRDKQAAVDVEKLRSQVYITFEHFGDMIDPGEHRIMDWTFPAKNKYISSPSFVIECRAHSAELECDFFAIAQNERHHLRLATAAAPILRRNSYDLLAFGDESQQVIPGEILRDGVSDDLPDVNYKRWCDSTKVGATETEENATRLSAEQS